MEENDFFNIEDLNLVDTTFNQIMGITEEEQNNTQEQHTETETDLEKDLEQKETTPNSEGQEDISTFSVFANLLKEKGVISAEDEDILKIKDADNLVELMKKELESSKFSNLSESQKRYLESVEAGIPQNQFEALEKQLSNLEAITEASIEDEDNTQTRFDLIAYDYISKGISKEKAIELANRSIKLETDVEDAKEALNNLIKSKNEEYKKLISEKKETNKISLEKLKSTIDSKEYILKDVKLTDKTKQELFSILTTKVDSDEEGQPLNAVNKWRKDNGVEADIILGAIYQLTGGFKNLGKLITTSKSQAALQLEQKLKQNDIKDISNSVSYNGNEYTINV